MLITGTELKAWMELPDNDTKEALLDQCADAADRAIRRWCTIPVDTEDITVAALMYGARLYRRHLTPDGIATFGGVDGMGAMRVGRFDPDFRELLEPFMDWAGMI